MSPTTSACSPLRTRGPSSRAPCSITSRGPRTASTTRSSLGCPRAPRSSRCRLRGRSPAPLTTRTCAPTCRCPRGRAPSPTPSRPASPSAWRRACAPRTGEAPSSSCGSARAAPRPFSRASSHCTPPAGEPGGGEGVLAGACLQRFYREAVGALAPRGLARMLEVRLDGAPVAAVLAFAHRRRVLHYAAGFDPSAARLSPGRIALAALFSRAIAERAREVDLLRGVEPHKYDWGARDRTTRTLRITRA
ncbi:MAG: GNAT family N-acetyltransferase [Sandaracinaceae bacterium]|nr:GNAT family N-acetyltransferase [Sandaracinaceae bacterium]